MNKQLAEKVKLPKEENNGNENKGRDPKEESSSTPERVEEKTETPEYVARSRESVSSMTRKKKQSLGCR